ncbi:hypothetical protein SISNIDRAFT_465184 [Sistotremastrum niveocremeum HHB9708]|uniref:F-box domain-containing protein n=1 Tax=Sistotremastrum niveocremeum HHB9708 TaxID=1314777 RepID=A0A164WCT7_9AGAM|nr:hypothetical protein SISNIDRAFT_465184 [Sistotremastrum niveocremeum HHB9708]
MEYSSTKVKVADCFGTPPSSFPWPSTQWADSLAKCARINKSLSEHALDVLYRYDPPLMKVLEILCPTRLDDEEWVFTEHIGPSHWNRFRHYSSRVRSIAIVNQWPNPLSQESILTLTTTIPRGEPLLPFMNSLHWEEIDESSAPLVLFLLHEKVKEVILSVTGRQSDDLDHGTFLGNMARRAPNLEDLHFWVMGERVSENAAKEVVDAVNSLPDLRNLDVFASIVSSDLLQAISSRQHLETFWASSFGPEKLEKLEEADVAHVMTSDVAAHQKFPRLREVSIPSFFFTKIGLEPPFLTSLISLHIDCNCLLADIPIFLPNVSRTCTRLRHFSMSIEKNVEPGFTLTMDMVRPLLNLKRIERLIIDTPSPPLLDDYDLSEFATAYPRLRHFELSPRAQGAPLAKSPTLAALIPFAANCTNLISIGIYMDASIPPPPLELDEPIFSSKFEVIHVLCCKITDHRSVVDFLTYILPSCADLRLSGYSHQLRYIEAEEDLADFFPDATSDDELLPESIVFRKEWEEAISLLDSLKWTRAALAKQRAEIQRLTSKPSSVGE